MTRENLGRYDFLQGPDSGRKRRVGSYSLSVREVSLSSSLVEPAATLDWAEGVKLMKNVLVPMRDGVRLAVDLYMPDADGSWPAVLDYRPYRKDDEHPPGGRFYEALTRSGYVVARVDVRGTGASEGASVDEYTR